MHPGDTVTGATVNTSASLTRVPPVWALRRLWRRWVTGGERAGDEGSIARLADRVSAVFVPVILTIAALTGRLVADFR